MVSPQFTWAPKIGRGLLGEVENFRSSFFLCSKRTCSEAVDFFRCFISANQDICFFCVVLVDERVFLLGIVRGDGSLWLFVVCSNSEIGLCKFLASDGGVCDFAMTRTSRFFLMEQMFQLRSTFDWPICLVFILLFFF